MKEITTYLLEKYEPEALIVYGSFADGTATEHSDFDALVVYAGAPCHDAAVVSGTVLDVFCYPAEHFTPTFDEKDFVQLLDGTILLDKSGLAQRVLERVRTYVNNQTTKTASEVQQALMWCRKMAARATRGDAEGSFRWHWLLVDSLEIYCDMRGMHYAGPKKALRYMAQHDPVSFHAYTQALTLMKHHSLQQWLDRLEQIWETRLDKGGSECPAITQGMEG